MQKNWLLALLPCAALLAGACQTDVAEDGPKQEKTVSVSLRLNEDVSVIYEDMTATTKALTRAATSTDDLYGINVYYDKEGDGVQDNIYGYGIFSDKSKMTIDLLANHQYKFECTLVKDGKNVLYFNQMKTGYPFQTTSAVTSSLTNSFSLGTTERLTGIKQGAAHLAAVTSPTSSNATGYASVNRFYGETSGYEPVEGGQVTIDLKRTVFGARFVVEGVQEGKLVAKCGDFWNLTTAADHAGAETLYTFPDVADAWANETPLTATLDLTFESDRGPDWNLTGSKQLTFKRNVMTTVTINVSPDLSGATVGLTEEPLDDDNVINIAINGDGIIETVVDPNAE